MSLIWRHAFAAEHQANDLSPQRRTTHFRFLPGSLHDQVSRRELLCFASNDYSPLFLKNFAKGLAHWYLATRILLLAGRWLLTFLELTRAGRRCTIERT